MNFFEDMIVEHDHSLIFRETSGQLLPVDADTAKAYVGSRVTYGIRPEHPTLSSSAEAISVEVDVVEPTGSETLVIGKLGDHTIEALLRERVHPQPGSSIKLKDISDHSHLFDSDAGIRL